MTSERGFALVIAVLTATLMLALGLALVLTTTSETIIAHGFQSAQEAQYACEAAIERAIADAAAAPDWAAIRDGAALSGFVDGPAGGSRTLADGSPLDLSQVVSGANAGRPGSVDPVWHLFAFGRLDALTAGGSFNSPYYVVVLAAGDPREPSPAAPRSLWLRGEAFGPRGIHRAIEVTIARGAGARDVRVLSWRLAALNHPGGSRTIDFEPIRL